MALNSVRGLLEQLAGQRPRPGVDGDLPVEPARALFCVRFVNGLEPMVQVFSVGVADIEASPDLMWR